MSISIVKFDCPKMSYLLLYIVESVTVYTLSINNAFYNSYKQLNVSSMHRGTDSVSIFSDNINS